MKKEIKVFTDIFYLVKGVSIHPYQVEGQMVPGLNEEIKSYKIFAVECIFPYVDTTLSEKSLNWYAKRQLQYKSGVIYLPVLLYTEYKKGVYLTHTLCLFNCQTFMFEDMDKGLQMSILLKKPELINN